MQPNEQFKGKEKQKQVLGALAEGQLCNYGREGVKPN
eukprot:CAMPEP_0174327608 /NCGR_PEP_ID=MMETSP0810-20121108/14608_1 /TAXON_ID=73025 ORGANISM="Eutreptiella gymnastica-like, Strain CCMP1594" /NCGR_SAMPLE_ID=MMETSP0810 /ASSEMBLY_ACC=CAM_ASM_000659 /LENGTH=36 /DNA_ID= /DNA_START= /DNA_END= /DNA_ORIENTATION=